MKQYDVAILGGGVGGATCAYKLIEENPKLKILILDNSSKESSGWRNDCKFNYDHEIGVINNSSISAQNWYNMFDFSINLFKKFIPNISEPEVNSKQVRDLEKRVKQNNAEFHFARQYHLGTERGVKFTKLLYAYLESKYVDIKPKSEVYHLDVLPNGIKKIFINNTRNKQQQKIIADKVVVSLGRNEGEHTTLMIAKSLGIKHTYNKSQFGGRLEVAKEDYPLTDIMYDPKIYFPFDTKTFCTNPGGYVVAFERDIYLGITTINGHALNGKKSDNTNLAIIVRMNSPNPNISNREYATAFAERIIKAGDGKPIAQRVEHFLSGVPSRNQHFEPEYKGVKPTLSRNLFVQGKDLAECMDVMIYQKFVDTLTCLNNIVGGNKILRGDGILYAPEIKNSINISTNNNYESTITGLYFIGDGSGKSRGINAAAATAQIVAKDILEKI